MERLASTPRAGWRNRLEQIGFTFHSAGAGYWDESACYRFSADEVDVLEQATAELHRLCLAAVDHALDHDLWDELCIPREYSAWVRASWHADAPSLCGRFDLAFDGEGPPRLLEYNADTPTSLLEAAVAQWHWLEDLHPGADQFNSLHERLVDRWRELAAGRPGPVHFAAVAGDEEDRAHVEYLADTAVQAGLEVRFVPVERIGLDAGGAFVDEEGWTIETLVKLYPWEWMVREEFGAALRQSRMRVVEPPWKMLLSNKAILPLLWRLFPDHPNLLAAYREPGRLGGRYVEKPVFSREGADVLLHDGGRLVRGTEGGYGAEGRVYQALADLPVFDGMHPVIGSWVVGDEPAGMGIREDPSPITTNLSRFVPHLID